MPYGNIMTWEEYIGDEKEKVVTFSASDSQVTDLRDQMPMDNLVTIRHQENGKIIYGTLVVENAKEKLLSVGTGSKIVVSIRNKSSSDQSFLNVRVSEETDDAK